MQQRGGLWSLIKLTNAWLDSLKKKEEGQKKKKGVKEEILNLCTL